MSDLEKYAAAIISAQGQVADAMEKYSSGGGLQAVNTANKALADARNRFAECSGNRVPDSR